MRLWSIELNKNDFDKPNIIFKGHIFHNKLEGKLKDEIFKIFYLTHRDEKEKIKIIETTDIENQYKHLYEMIFPPKKAIYKIEYLVELLNTFNVEL